MHQGCKARDIGGEELHRDQGVCGHKLKQGAGGSRQLPFELILRPCLSSLSCCLSYGLWQSLICSTLQSTKLLPIAVLCGGAAHYLEHISSKEVRRIGYIDRSLRRAVGFCSPLLSHFHFVDALSFPFG